MTCLNYISKEASESINSNSIFFEGFEVNKDFPLRSVIWLCLEVNLFSIVTLNNWHIVLKSWTYSLPIICVNLSDNVVLKSWTSLVPIIFPNWKFVHQTPKSFILLLVFLVLSEILSLFYYIYCGRFIIGCEAWQWFSFISWLFSC